MSVKPTPLNPIPGAIPSHLIDRPRFVGWNYEGDDCRKVPRQVGGNFAKCNSPSTWTDFNTIVGAKSQFSGGIGWVIDGDTVGIDIDSCINDAGEFSAVAREWLTIQTYWEKSPSGKGIRGFLLLNGAFEQLKSYRTQRSSSPQMEVYRKNGSRYLTLTGHVISDCRKVSPAPLEFFKLMTKYLHQEGAKEGSQLTPLPVDAELTMRLATAAIDFIDPDCVYYDWLSVGMSLCSYGESGFKLWNDWSKAGNKYPGEADVTAL